jgi:acyl-CoA synthetase (AMP-forming)/AMP-acid ligase II
MTPRPGEGVTLLGRLRSDQHGQDGKLFGAEFTLDLGALHARTSLLVDPTVDGRRCALVHVTDPLAAAVALVELDGIAQRIVLCPPGVAAEHLAAIVAAGQVDCAVSDEAAPVAGLEGVPQYQILPARLPRIRAPRAAPVATEWVLLTSGTSGVPKLVVHTLHSLSGAIAANGPLAGPRVWSTFYDIRRYGGLQILLRALIGGGSLVVSHPNESIDDFAARSAHCAVTHVTGTPSHWRRALMSPALRQLAPKYVRMSGEIADQGIIDRLKAQFPDARVAHAFASTEAGVGFEIDDGLEGFPQSLAEQPDAAHGIKVEHGTLRIRSARNGLRYLGEAGRVLGDPDGFVDTGDVVELRGGRYYFVGRRDGVINVGGLKVHPEEVEAVINRHPGVRMSLVKARRNPITGAVVVAEVMRAPDAPGAVGDRSGDDGLRRQIMDLCRSTLAPYKVPALIRIVERIEVSASGKVLRAES